MKFPKRKLKANVVYCADNLEVMKQLPSNSIDLIYIDPPFNTGTLRKSKAWDKKVQVGDFDDKWGGGINSYVLWLENRLHEMHRLLKETGVLCVHLDYKSVHYIKVCLDKIFGYGNPDKGASHLINELIWYFSGAAPQKRTFAKKHNTILIYGKDKKSYSFYPDQIRVPYEGNGGYQNSKGILNNGKRYNPNPLGKIPTDVLKIPIIHPNDTKERVKGKWPTQKPIALLKIILKAFSKKNDIVADFFCGCGTTISVSERLGRKWIGCDVHQEAGKTIRKRMARDHKLDIDILQLKSLTKSQILNLSPDEFEKYAVRSIGGIPTSNSKPVDGYMPDGSPIEVKMNDKPIGVEVLDKFHRFLQKNGRGYIVSKAFGRGFKDEVARLKLEEGIDVVFITIDDIMRDVA